MKNNYTQLEELLLQKEFSELKPQQQTWVQDFMSPQEYDAQRKILTESKAILSEKSILPAGDLAALQAQFKATHQHHYR